MTFADSPLESILFFIIKKQFNWFTLGKLAKKDKFVKKNLQFFKILLKRRQIKLFLLLSNQRC